MGNLHGRMPTKSIFPDIQKTTGLDYAVKIMAIGDITYVAQAAPGALISEAKWQVQKIDVDGNVAWADGDSNFDNTATDLTALSYS